MRLSQLRSTWDAFGATDPLWAILTHPGKHGGRWDLEEFLRTGEDEVDALVAHLETLVPGFTPRRALDFGCGVGRVTRALARRVAEVHGVDIARSMVERARALGAVHGPGGGRCICHYHENVAPHLGAFADRSFDLVHSRLTLQHVPPPLQTVYVEEFCRLLAPGGLAVFQIAEAPLRPLNWRGRCLRTLYLAWNRHLRRRPVMDMFGQPRARVVSTVAAQGCRALEVVEDDSCGPDWVSVRYVVTRDTSGAARGA